MKPNNNARIIDEANEIISLEIKKISTRWLSAIGRDPIILEELNQICSELYKIGSTARPTTASQELMELIVELKNEIDTKIILEHSRRRTAKGWAFIIANKIGLLKRKIKKTG